MGFYSTLVLDKYCMGNLSKVELCLKPIALVEQYDTVREFHNIGKNPMIKKVIVLFVVLAIGATVAYQKGWLSRKGEKAYDRAAESILDKGEEIVDNAKDAVK